MAHVIVELIPFSWLGAASHGSLESSIRTLARREFWRKKSKTSNTGEAMHTIKLPNNYSATARTVNLYPAVTSLSKSQSNNSHAKLP